MNNCENFDINYLAGFIPALVVSFLIPVCASLYITIRLVFGSRDWKPAWVFFYFMSASIFLCLPVLLMLFPIINFWYVWQLICPTPMRLIEAELVNGALGLRITSVVIGYHFVSNLWKKISSKQRRVEYSNEFPELIDLSRQRNAEQLLGIELYQILFFTMIAFLLWAFKAISAHGTAIALISWGFFFIIDDWAIIKGYSFELKGRILKWHRMRLVGFNLLLFVSSIVAIFLTDFPPFFSDRHLWKSIILSIYAIVPLQLLWSIHEEEIADIKSKIKAGFKFGS